MRSKILIVEDDRDFASSLEMALELIDRKSVVAGSAEEALQLLRESRDEISIGFFDIKLPGEDGISCFEKIRQERPGMVGVIMTGFRDEQVMERARSAGAVEILLKPFKMANFMELAKKYTPDRIGEDDGR